MLERDADGRLAEGAAVLLTRPAATGAEADETNAKVARALCVDVVGKDEVEIASMAMIDGNRKVVETCLSSRSVRDQGTVTRWVKDKSASSYDLSPPEALEHL